MLEGRDILVFADDWGRYPSTMQHIGRILSENNRLLWVGSLGLRRPAAHPYHAKRLFEKGKKIVSGMKHHRRRSGVIQIHPPVIPLHDSRLIRLFNTKILRSTLFRKMKVLGFKHPILLTSSPLVGDLIGTLGESSSHYICLDDFTLFEGAFHSLASLESSLLEKVDSSFSVSTVLFRTRVPRSGINHFIAQGVDTEHFTPVRDLSPPKKIDLPRPIVGFFGILAPWVDLPLMIQCARALPEATIVLLGRTSVAIDELRSSPNIHHLGEVPYEELPRYASFFDVGLIPFHVNELTIAANPLKLLEYLSLGLPVVSTDLPEVRKFRPWVSVAQSPEEFIELIQLALADDNEEKRKARHQIALEHSWTNVVETICSAILETERQKEHKRRGVVTG